MRTKQSVFLVVMAAAFVMAGCGGSSKTPKSDAGRDVSGSMGGMPGVPGAGGVFGSGGSPGSGAGGSPGAGGAGGARVDGGGDTGGGSGGSPGSGGTPAGDAGPTDAGDAPRADAADAAPDSPSTPDVPVDTGADVILVIDGGPTVVACPNDVVAATCTSGNVCVRTSGEVCGCLGTSRWFCPGVAVGTDGGITVFDAAADAPATPTCGDSAMTGAACTTEGEICRIPGSIGCGCLTLGNSLRWLCR
jgi:hypothetical protein